MGFLNKILESTAPIAGLVPGGSQIMGAGNKIGGSMGGGGEAVPNMEPLNEPEEPKARGFVDRVNKGMGNNIGKTLTGVAAGFIDDARGRRNSKKRFDDLKGEGLTSQEIAGGGGSAGSVPAQGTVLGNGPATQINQQQKHQKEENAKDRARDVQVEEIRQGVPRQREGREQRLQFGREVAQEQDINIKQELHQERFARLIATMADNNVKISVLLRKYNMRAEEWLNPKGPATEKQIRTAEAILNDISQFAAIPDQVKGLFNTMRGATRQVFNIKKHRNKQLKAQGKKPRYDPSGIEKDRFQTMGNKKR